MFDVGPQVAELDVKLLQQGRGSSFDGEKVGGGHGDLLGFGFESGEESGGIRAIDRRVNCSMWVRWLSSD